MYLAVQITILIVLGIIVVAAFCKIWTAENPLAAILQLFWTVWLGWCLWGMIHLTRFLNGQISELPSIGLWN